MTQECTLHAVKRTKNGTKWKVLTQVYKLQVKVLVIFHQAAKIIYKYLFFDNIWVMQVLNLEYEKEELFFPGGVFDLFPI